MPDTVLYENSMFTTPTERATLVQDGKLCTELFFINYLGFLGLYALNDSRGYMKTYEQTEKKLKINDIADDNHDASLIVKLCVDAGVLPEAKTLQVTKFLALIKQRTVRSKDVDSVRVRALIEQTLLHVKPMGALVKAPVAPFMDGTIDVKEFARQIYDVAKNNTYRPYTNEFRTLVLKGQYTDYFTVMKRGGTVAPPANQVAGIPANVKPAAITPPAGAAPTPSTVKTAARPTPNLPKTPTDAEFDTAVQNAFAAANGRTNEIFQSLDAYVLSHPIRSSVMQAGVIAAITRLPDSVFAKKWEHSNASSTWAAPIELRLYDALTKSGKWSNAKFTGRSVAWTGTMNSQHDASTVAVIREQIRRAVVDFGIPTPSRADDWIQLSVIARDVFTPAEREAHFASLIDPKSATAHNMHLKTLLVNRLPGTPWLYSADAVDPKVATWIRSLGQKIGGTDVIVASTMTSALWNTISLDDKMLWTANNWTPESAKRAGSLWGQQRRTPRINQTTETARKQMADIIGAKAFDSAVVTAMYRAADSFDFMSQMICMAAMITMNETKKPVTLPTFAAAYMKLGSEYTSGPEALRFASLLKSIDVSTSAGVDEFVGFAKAMVGGQTNQTIGDLPDGVTVNLKATNPGASGIHWLGWVSNYKVNWPGVKANASASTLVIDRAACSPEVAAWIDLYGNLGNYKMVFAKTYTSTDSLAEDMLVAFTDGDDTTRLKEYIVDDHIIADLAVFTEDKWYEIAKSIWTGKRTTTSFKTQKTYLSSFISGRRIDWGTFPNMSAGFNRFIMNDMPSAAVVNLPSSMCSLAHLRPPMTSEKLDKAQHAMSSRRYGGDNLDENYVSELFHTAISGKVFAPGVGTDFTLYLAETARAHDADRYAQSCLMAMNESFDPLRAIIVAVMTLRSVAQAITADEYPSYRWAWGFDAATVTEMLKEANQALGDMAAQNRFAPDWTPLQLVPGKYVSESRFDADFLKQASAYIKTSPYASYLSPSLSTAPWIDEVEIDAVKPPPRDPNGYIPIHHIQAAINTLGGAARGDEVAKVMIMDLYDSMKHPKLRDGLTAHQISAIIKISREYGVDAAIIKDGVKATFEAYEKRKSKPVDYAELATELGKEGGDYVSTEDMGAIIKKLATSTSAACQAAISDLAYTSTSNGQVSKTFIDAVRAANVERAMINRLGKNSIMSQAVTRINGDPKGVKVDVKPERMNDFLKYNDVDVSVIGSTVVKRLEDIGSVNDKLNAIIPGLYLEEDTTPGVLVAKARDLHRSNRYNHSPALGLEVKRAFKVTLPGQQERFDRWLAANGQTKIMTLFHGTGTYAAQFLLRYGFRIIKATDGSVTGRMLGDGIYFADNINKSMLYMSNAGYIRQAGQEGYVFKCKVALGRSPKDHREGNKERTGLVSNEWSIMSVDQIVIEEAYYGISQRRDEIRRLLNEAADQYSPNVSSFMFMDGQIPITPDLLVDFAKLPDFGAHVSIETSAKGPIVNIRHDATVEPVDRCYRWGEELTATSKKKELKQFLDLLHNRY